MSKVNLENPLIVQGDHTVLAEVESPRYAQARDELARFAELVKSPEHIHTYRITPLSIWNACAAGVKTDQIIGSLHKFSKYPIPEHVLVKIQDFASRYGRLKLMRRDSETLILSANAEPLAEEISHNNLVLPLLAERLSPLTFRIESISRGKLKQALVKIGFPAEDLAGYTKGEELCMEFRNTTVAGEAFLLRSYQNDSVRAFHANGSNSGGSGVIVLPCGAGKTIVGIACMARLQSSTLILTTSVTAVRQWKNELLDKTTLTEEQIGEYSGKMKQIRPITLATYQIMTYRKTKDSNFEHMSLFDQRNWGLIIYDEVHLLPAPVFQFTAFLQARRRLGLTATLVREDGRENDVFALIGPKKADAPWKTLEKQGWIAKADCTEIRIPLPQDIRMPYAVADSKRKFRIASENPLKEQIVKNIISRYKQEKILIIAMYLDQIKSIAKNLDIPVLTGSTSQDKRDKLFADFKEGKIHILAVSKIANFAVDLPDASVAIQISGTFGSRQEEAQRLGRILRPKQGLNRAHFFTLVSADTIEQDFALKRQLFLCEQGYTYSIRDTDREDPNSFLQ
ncbi:UvsW helicase [Limihaloglobus sulfuriphilus]|uniref:DNA 3'-5' helicase n=1 Tax=Limihaloglobus sulfuriphilus TaxID=1851148 RepID=A0A1Q2MGS1_9BACT|nr:DNA repair helicase XPB [Limihaloglobus sulfuriphilus]AQQ71880.1 UvsW helicase [Limihaloglobus sulfuriphilus]